MSLLSKAKVLEKLAVDNSPTLLTAIGVIGTVGTAVLSGKAAAKSERELDVVRQVNDKWLDRQESIKLTWKNYIPPVVSGTVTVGCIIMANHIGTKRAAAIAAAYTLSERAYSEYKEKVVETIGDKEERKIRDEVVKDRVHESAPSSTVLVVGNGDILCLEMWTGQYFMSTHAKIMQAMNAVNFNINANGYASLYDFHNELGIPQTDASDEVGWTGDKLMDIEFTSALTEDNRAVLAIKYRVVPIRDYLQFH